VISQDISGFSLPGVQLPQGGDEVRAADGTTCRSAISGAGAYLDVGVIGNPNATNGKDYAAYGRVVIPLGRKPPRLDCSKLYELEVERLTMELRLMQMGLGNQGMPASVDDESVASVSPDEPTMEKTAAKPVSTKKKPKARQANGEDWADDGWSTDGKGE
jgi:hypothetical protein